LGIGPHSILYRNVLSPKLSKNSVEELIWNSFAMSADLQLASYYFCVAYVFMVSLWNSAGHYIFVLWFLLSAIYPSVFFPT